MELQATSPSAIEDGHKKGKLSSSSVSTKNKLKRPATAIEDDDDDDDSGMSAKHKKLIPEDCDDEEESDYEKDELAQQLQVEKQNAVGAAHRLWREEDIIALLKGMISFSRMKGLRNPMSRSADFHEFIKDSFPFDVSRRKLSDKVFRLKKKYETNLKDPRTPNLLTEHEKECFRLSHDIWGTVHAEEEDNPLPPPPAPFTPAALVAPASGSKCDSVLLLRGDFSDGFCLRCMMAGPHELGDDALEKMRKPVCKDAKLVRKWKAMNLAEIFAAEKHADFLKTDARLLSKTIQQEDD